MQTRERSARMRRGVRCEKKAAWPSTAWGWESGQHVRTSLLTGMRRKITYLLTEVRRKKDVATHRGEERDITSLLTELRRKMKSSLTFFWVVDYLLINIFIKFVLIRSIKSVEWICENQTVFIQARYYKYFFKK